MSPGSVMLVVGLTGGIATGKSTVSAMLQERGAHIVDADRIARQVVEPGLPAWKGVIEAFGREILLADGSIDRVSLGQIVFNDSLARKRLDEIVHPFVFEAMAHELVRIEASNPEAIAVLDVPLLIESGMHRNLADVLLVYAPEPIQMRRLMARDRLSEEEALCRVRSQMPIEEKRLLATIVIDNSGDRASTAGQVDAVFAYLVRKSKDPALQWNN
ncbi:dephospho-CoA kinase [Desulfatirhabdium butyrativorans]|uniref:dephospho-CoA kinase n=1 Tax=Desulfatirhabdium butyrativorans TaxID=340467 RepID=UPI000481A63E|nr:dephospho-CoA kinase [Desulfatirhabdium butyrativorans]